MVHGGASGAQVDSCLLHVGADGGEGGGEVVKGRCERGACVPDRKGDELHPYPMFLEGRDKGGVSLGLLRELDAAVDFLEKAGLDDINGAYSFV